ncbi:unnamed protein product [Brassica rapa]|uniref:Uncharacterized protein n=2 Tax=Brassica campestris TaxID=3711 RepID=A0A3P5ZI57_BRACM|nr:unnamed protein product [Brassica rapa]VDC74043.1 unnamed protein product [Brassica rapa]
MNRIHSRIRSNNWFDQEPPSLSLFVILTKFYPYFTVDFSLPLLSGAVSILGLISYLDLTMTKEYVMLILLMMIVFSPFLPPLQFFGSSDGIILTGPDFTRKFNTVESNTADSVEIRVCDAIGVVYMAESLDACEKLILERDMLMLSTTTTRSFFVTKETAQVVNKYICRPNVAVMRVPIHTDHLYGLITRGLLFYTFVFLLLRFFS